MFGKILLGLFTASVVIFLIGVLGCIFWLGMAALGFFIKIMLPIILIILIVGVIASLLSSI